MIDKIAKLAKLEFTSRERERLIKDLEEIMNYVEALNEVDTEGVAPTSHIHDLVNNHREDLMQPWFSQNEAVQNAPKSNRGYFTVSKVIK